MKNLKQASFVLVAFMSAVVLLSSGALPVSAQQESTEPISAPIGVTKAGNYSVSGATVTVDQDVKGDLFATGTDITVLKPVKDIAFISGNKISLEGNVKGDVFIAGQKVLVKSNIGENAFIASPEIQIDGKIGNDAYIAASRVIVNGEVNGDLRVSAAEVYLNTKKVKGDLVISADTSKISISPDIRVSGDVIINDVKVGEEEMKKYTESVGAKDLSELSPVQGFDFGSLVKVGSVWQIVIAIASVFGSVIAVWLMFKLMPVKSKIIMKNMDISAPVMLRSFLFGLAAIFGGSILFVILLVSIIGWPVLAILFPLGLFVLGVNKYFIIYKIGELIVPFLKKEYKENIWIVAIVGTLVYTLVNLVVMMIPVVGQIIVGLAASILTIWAVGAIVRIKFDANFKVAKK